VRVARRRELDDLQQGSEPGDFALSGQVTCEEDGARVSVRLVDCRDASQVWAEDYRSEPGAASAFFEDTARVIAARVASEQGIVAQRLWADQRSRPDAEATTPYGAILRSYRFFFNREPSDFEPALLALQRTVRERPECVLAWVQLSRLYSVNYSFEITDIDTPIDVAIGHAQNAVHLDPSSQRARVILAGAFLLKGELDAGRDEAERAFAANPSSLTYLEWIGWLITMLGDWERGPAIVRGAMARNPHHVPVALHALWADHLRRGELDEAYQAALRYQDATFFWRALMRACCLGHLGRTADAKLAVAELLRSKPGFASRGRTLIGRYIKFPELVARIVEGLGKAGLTIE
jgi:adenylate cyclase